MLIVQGRIVDESILSAYFVCNLSACKGACCWEGEYGAPLETAELHTLEAIYDRVAPFLSPAGKEVIAREGLYTYYKDMKTYGTPLLDDGSCAYLTYGSDGVALCGLERAWREGASPFRKPISCHLYPIRVSHDRKTGFETLRYDRWDICSAACSLGKRESVPLYVFAREALERAYGPEFYQELEAMASYLEK